MNQKTNKPVKTAEADMKKSPSRKKVLNRKSPSLLALEARLMFDGAVAQTVDQTLTQPEAIPQQPVVPEVESSEPALDAVSYAQPKDELAAEDSSTDALMESEDSTSSAAPLISLAEESEASTESFDAPFRVILVSG